MRLGTAYRRATVKTELVRQALYDGIRQAASDGMNESEIARQAGVTRMTTRKALGK